MRRSLAIAGAGLFACAAVGTPLHAQGSAVDQQSACMTGRVGAGVASPCDDASGIYFSPAGLAQQGSAFSVGVTLVNAGNDFTYDVGAAPAGSPTRIERDRETVPVPQAFLSYKVHPRLAAGIGVFAPFGLGIKWPVCSLESSPGGCGDGGENFEGRYTGYDNALRAVMIQPTLSFDLIPGRLSVGAGLDYVRGSIEVHQRADAPTIGLRGRDVADVTLKGDGTGLTANVGAILHVGQNTSIGVRYLHSTEIDFTGDAAFVQVPTGTIFDPILAAQFATGGPFTNQGIATSIKFPHQLVAGISFRPVEVLNLLFDYQRTGWSSFDQFDVDFQGTSPDRVLTLDYRDTNTYRLAADFMYSDALSFRAGFRYNTAATPRATPFLPEGERNYYTAGIGWRVTRALSADFAYQYINQPTRRGAVRPDEPSIGTYDAFGQTFGFTLAYRWGARPMGQ
ncbi:MAG TPA: outer membrane protein transport protein [Longimicrobium sp.]|nr:outer membrane protein transport protein [Longimicrobium sp.]